MDLDAVLTMDIGGGHVTAGVVEAGSLVPASIIRRSASPHADAGALLDGWAGAALDAVAAWSPDRGPARGSDLGQEGEPERPAAVAIAMPAPFDYADGVSRMVHKFAPLFGVDVGSALRERWRRGPLDGVPVVFGNDADLWALGEAVAGEGQGYGRVIGITLGTGLGSGFVADGRVVRHGEQVPHDGELWNVAFGDGMAEDRASGRAVVERYEQRTGRTVDAASIAVAARAGDSDAAWVLEEMGADLGAVLAPWAKRFRADAVILGGNVSRAFDRFGPTLVAALRDGLGADIAVRCTVRFETSTLLGAAALARGRAAG